MQNLRKTHQREVILEELKAYPVHPTTDELYERVRKKLPRISLATVYRNLEVLSELGVIQKIETSGRQKRFDGNPQEHYHIRCIHCGKVDDIDVDEEGTINIPEKSRHGFSVIGYKIEFTGICPACSSQKKD